MDRISRKTIVRAFVLILVVIILHYTHVLLPLERLWQTTFSGLGSIANKSAGDIAFWHGWQEKEDLANEVDELRARLQQNEASFARLSALEKENEELKEAIRWRDIQNSNYLIGKSIGRPLNLPNTFILINRGSRDGVTVGHPVIIGNDILIGKVLEVREDTSLVRLITDNKSVFSARLSDGTEPIGRVIGQLGLSLMLDTVPATEELTQGDIIVTSGLDPLVPEGLVIGSLQDILKEPGEFFQSATVGISYDPKEISVISVIISQ